MQSQRKTFPSLAKAKTAFPEWVSAETIRDLVKVQYYIDLHPTNIGNIGKRYERTVMFWKGSYADRRTGHLYNPEDVPFYAWMLYLLQASRSPMHISLSNPEIEALDEVFVNEIGGLHHHHVIPKHAGGTDDSENIVSLTIYQHAIAHKRLYEEYGRHPDFWAWRRLIAMCLKREF